MNLRKTVAAAGMVALLAGTAACGGSSSSTAAAPESSDAPSGATQTAFCTTFTTLDSKTTPKQASAKLGAVGTPSNIDAASRKGFDVLVAGLAKLPDDAKSADFTAMQKSLDKTQQTEVEAFGAYLAKECVPASPSPSASLSPSS